MEEEEPGVPTCTVCGDGQLDDGEEGAGRGLDGVLVVGRPVNLADGKVEYEDFSPDLTYFIFVHGVFCEVTDLVLQLRAVVVLGIVS